MQSQEVWAGQPMKPTACSVVKRPQLTKVRGVHGVECSEVQRSFWTLGRLRQHPRKGARPQSPGVYHGLDNSVRCGASGGASTCWGLDRGAAL